MRYPGHNPQGTTLNPCAYHAISWFQAFAFSKRDLRHYALVSGALERAARVQESLEADERARAEKAARLRAEEEARDLRRLGLTANRTTTVGLYSC
jgi:hypothetical protein